MIFESFKSVFVFFLALASVSVASPLATRQTQAVCCHNCDDDPSCQVTLGGKTPFYRVSANTLVGVECGEQGLPHVIVCSVTLDPLGKGPQEN
jgi:hypothetical protein